MAKLKPGSVTIDLATGGIYGDLDHCPLEDLLESAEALLSLLPKVEHQGLWGLHKDFDADCYIYTAAQRYQLDQKSCALEADIYHGPAGMDGPWTRPFHISVALRSDRVAHWRTDWYSRLIGSIKNGHASPDTQGVPDLTAEKRAEHKRWLAQCERNKPPQQVALQL
jgi:hypothetical protein